MENLYYQYGKYTVADIPPVGTMVRMTWVDSGALFDRSKEDFADMKPKIQPDRGEVIYIDEEANSVVLLSSGTPSDVINTICNTIWIPSIVDIEIFVPLEVKPKKSKRSAKV